MKNLIAKISSLTVLAIILTVVSVQAQSSRKYDAEIPFDFIIGNKTYKAGNYIIRVKNQFSDALLKIKNAKTRDWREMIVMANGSRSKMDKTVLMFDRYGDQYVLKQFVSPDFGFSAPKTKAKKLTAKKFGKPENSVAIVLIKQDKIIE